MKYEAYRKAKKQVEKAETKEEKKSLIEEAGMQLSDEEMNNVAGGSYNAMEIEWDIVRKV